MLEEDELEAPGSLSFFEASVHPFALQMKFHVLGCKRLLLPAMPVAECVRVIDPSEELLYDGCVVLSVPPLFDAPVSGTSVLDTPVFEPSVWLLDACGLVGDGLVVVAACVWTACGDDAGAVGAVTGGFDWFEVSSAVESPPPELDELIAG